MWGLLGIVFVFCLFLFAKNMFDNSFDFEKMVQFSMFPIGWETSKAVFKEVINSPASSSPRLF